MKRVFVARYDTHGFLFQVGRIPQAGSHYNAEVSDEAVVFTDDKGRRAVIARRFLNPRTPAVLVELPGGVKAVVPWYFSESKIYDGWLEAGGERFEVIDAPGLPGFPMTARQLLEYLLAALGKLILYNL